MPPWMDLDLLWLAEAHGYGVPVTIQHDDFHDGQVFVHDGRYLLLDWGDCCVSHPFCSLAVTLERGIAWGLDAIQEPVDIAPFRAAYLGPFSRAGSDVVAAAVFAPRLGWVCRAVDGHVPGDLDGTRIRLRMFVDGHP